MNDLRIKKKHEPHYFKSENSMHNDYTGVHDKKEKKLSTYQSLYIIPRYQHA